MSLFHLNPSSTVIGWTTGSIHHANLSREHRPDNAFFITRSSSTFNVAILRLIVPVKELLKHSGLKVDEIYALELIGGGTRVPKLQAKLQEFFGRSGVDRHLDADEATVLGASLHAAILSDGIKLSRKLGMIDGSMYGFMMDLDGPELVKDETTTQLLVPRLKKLPIKMFRSITHNKDFDVTLLYENEDLLPPGITSRTFAKYAVSGLADASEK